MNDFSRDLYAEINFEAGGYLFPFMAVGGDVAGDHSRGQILSFLECIQQTRTFVPVGLVSGHVQIRAPISRIETPMARPVLERFMRVAHKLLCRKQPAALHALDAFAPAFRIQGRSAHPRALAKTLVVHPKRQSTGLRHRYRHYRGTSVHQGAAQPLSIRLLDQAAGGCSMWEDAGVLQFVQLLWRTPRAVDLQPVALLIDLMQGEVSEDAIQDLGQAQTLLAADNKT